jgi:hypothetical protein
MKQHPILMKGPLVKQSEAGNKTQTRRLKALEEINKNPDRWEFVRLYDGYAKFCEKHNYTKEVYVKCPYGVPDEILWVRETWRKYCHVDNMGYTHFDQQIIEYAADNPPMIYLVDGDGAHMYNKDGSEKYVPWRPSIHMPKSACRLFLQITDIRVERLQDISEEDAKAEGLACLSKDGGITYKYGIPDKDGLPGIDNHGWPWQEWNTKPVEAFKALWGKVNGLDSWQANPWVWVITFKRINNPNP